MNIEKTMRIASVVLTILTIILAAFFIFQVLDIYYTGTAPANQPAPGVYVTPVYSEETVRTHLAPIMPLFFLWLILCAALSAARLFYPVRKKIIEKQAPLRCISRNHLPSPRTRRLTLLALMCAAALTAAGIMNGGMHEVLVKAIMICSECIGLG